MTATATDSVATVEPTRSSQRLHGAASLAAASDEGGR